jgi:glycosyltransferase involved in cell wall biosynthesis
MATAQSPIRIGVTDTHGVASELVNYPPDNAEYRLLKPTRRGSPVFRSPIRVFFSRYDTTDCDLVEAVCCPIHTDKRWILSLCVSHEIVAFNVLGVPLPRSVRAAYMRRLFLRNNFRFLFFWSQAGYESLKAYPLLNDPAILDKTRVVYPAIRRVADQYIQFNDGPVQLLFMGDFFRKGGAALIDAFERLQQQFTDIRLRLCCDEDRDFFTDDPKLRTAYLDRIHRNQAIQLGRIPRQQMLETVWPETDIYLLPTYDETFGFAVLEAAAFGVPVICTDIFALPELVEHEKTGLLIHVLEQTCRQMVKGYVVTHLDPALHEDMTEQLYQQLRRLIESPNLRRQFGETGLARVRSAFSFDRYNQQVSEYFTQAMAQ